MDDVNKMIEKVSDTIAKVASVLMFVVSAFAIRMTFNNKRRCK